MTDRYEQLEKTLKQHGYSVTKTRRKVFEALDQQEPQTISNLIKSVGKKVDRASIYRSIKLFEKLGIVQRLQQGWKYKLELADAFHYHHHHFTCTNCGLTVPLREDSMLEARIDNLARDMGLQPKGHQLEITGLCNSCVQNSRTPGYPQGQWKPHVSNSIIT